MERQPEALTASSNVPTRRRRRAAAGAANGDTSQLGSQKDASPQLKRSASTLHTYDSLPDYLQDNEFIITGYRANLPVKATLKSFWEWHNETGNIWTHFLGGSGSGLLSKKSLVANRALPFLACRLLLLRLHHRLVVQVAPSAFGFCSASAGGVVGPDSTPGRGEFAPPSGLSPFIAGGVWLSGDQQAL
jgi:hypothetical protein